MKTVRRRWLLVGLQQRLGNQLFQYASGYGIARALGAELSFDAHRVPPGELRLPEIIGDSYREAPRSRLLRVGVIHNDSRLDLRVARRLLRAARTLGDRTPFIVPEGGDFRDPGRFRSELLRIDLPAYLLGYLQTERYFAAVRNEVADRIALPNVPAIRSEPTVAVSFRRGDYVELGLELPFGYHERALGLMNERLGNPTFVLFGDDPGFMERAANRVAAYGRVRVAADVCGPDPVRQLGLMSSCDHSIIANSSYSWWGAWLGDRAKEGQNRFVLAPADYARTVGGADLLPAHWMRLES